MASTSSSSLITWVLTALVIAISAFTHLYRIDQTFVFHNDEGRDALISYRMIDTKRPVLLGPETSVGNMYLGPFYYYLMVPALAISGLNPVGPAIMVALLGIATTAMLIYLGKKNSNFASGLVAGLFYALSPVMVHYSRSSWNPNVIPFFIILILIIYQQKSKWFGILFGALTGILFQLHYVALVIPALLYLRDLYLSIKTKQSKVFLVRTTPLIIIGFVITTLPFWLFEMRHEFINIKAFFQYIIEKSNTTSSPYPSYLSRLWNNIMLLVKGGVASISESQIKPPTMLIALIFSTLVLYCIRVKGIYSYLLLSSILIISILRENIHIHYLAFIFPIIAFIIGQSITQKKVLSFLAFMMLVMLLPATYQSLRYSLFENVSTQTVRAQNLANYIVDQAAGEKYNIVSPNTSSTATILYYLAISSNPPRTTDERLLFVLCTESLCSPSVTTDTNLFVNGPAHPTLIDYLGYTPRLYSSEPRTMIKNEWVTYELHVATITRP